MVREFCGYSSAPPAEVDGHRVYCQAASGGFRQPGIVIHKDLADSSGSPVFLGRAMGVSLQHPLLGPRWLVSAHLDPSSCRKQYLESCTDLVSVLQLCPSDAVTIIGLDAQTCLDGVDGSGFFVGPFTSDNLLPRRPPLAD